MKIKTYTQLQDLQAQELEKFGEWIFNGREWQSGGAEQIIYKITIYNIS